MAGIGFRLNKLLRSDDVYQKLTGAIASVLLSTGPWLCTILGIAAIGSISADTMEPGRRDIFRIIINYTYMGSLIGFSFLEMVSTRYLADAIYLRKERVIPTFYTWLNGSLFVFATLFTLFYYSFSNLDWKIIVLAMALFCAVSSVWCSMIFLSSCKDYLNISLSFVFGMIVSVGSSYFFGKWMGLEIIGFLGGFTFGQVVTAGLLGYRIFFEYGTGFMSPGDFPSFCYRHRSFIFVGLFYALAVWVDKVIFWLNPETSDSVGGIFFRSPTYDTGLFLAYLFVVPSMAYFMVQMETSFYMAYRRYFALIENRAPLNLIDRGRLELIEVMRQSISGLVFFQCLASGLALIFAIPIIKALGLPHVVAVVFRYGLIGSTLHVFLLFVNILILYFDLPKVVARNYFIFFVTNGVASYLTASMDIRYHGIGYALSALLILLLSVFELNRVLKEMNYNVFMRQPITKTAGAAPELQEISLK